MVKGHLDLVLLSVLRSGPLHGYAVIASMRERSGGELDLPEGTVYPALHKLERSGSVSSRWEIVDGRKRRVYELTAVGTKVLAAERREWRRFASVMSAVVGA